jgi:hypothetical protein
VPNFVEVFICCGVPAASGARKVLGILYITAGDMFMDAFALVIERLAGQ